MTPTCEGETPLKAFLRIKGFISLKTLNSKPRRDRNERICLNGGKCYCIFWLSDAGDGNGKLGIIKGPSVSNRRLGFWWERNWDLFLKLWFRWVLESWRGCLPYLSFLAPWRERARAQRDEKEEATGSENQIPALLHAICSILCIINYIGKPRDMCHAFIIHDPYMKHNPTYIEISSSSFFYCAFNTIGNSQKDEKLVRWWWANSSWMSSISALLSFTQIKFGINSN